MVSSSGDVGRIESILKKFLVISYDSDQQQFFYDVVFDLNAEHAKMRVLSLRDYCQDADVLTEEELTTMGNRVARETYADSEAWFLERMAEKQERDS